MAVLKWIAIVVVVILVVAVLAGYIFLKTFDIDQHRGKLEQKLSEAAHTEVTLGKLALNWSWDAGAELRIKRITMEDDDKTDGRSLLEVRDVRATLNLQELLKNRRLVLEEVLIESPRIYVRKSVENQLNIPEAGKQSAGASASARDDSPRDERESTAEKTPPDHGEKMEWVVSSIKVEKGTVIYEDRTASPAKIIEIKDLQVTVTEAGFDRPIEVLFECALFSDARNVRGRADVVVEEDAPHKTTVSNIQFQTDLATLKVKSVLDLLTEDDALINKISGKVTLNGDKIILNGGLPPLMNWEMNFVDGLLEMPPVGTPLSRIQLGLLGAGKDIVIKDAQLRVADGSLTYQGGVSNYFFKPSLQGNLAIEGIQLGKIPALTQHLPFEIESELSGSANIAGVDLLTDDILNVIQAKGNFSLEDARIVDVNLFREVMSKLTLIPGLEKRLKENLSGKYQDILNDEGTTIDDARIDFSIMNGQINFDVVLEARGLLVVHKGMIDQLKTIRITREFYVQTDLSADLIKAVEEFAYLKNAQNKIEIPFESYQGPIDQVRMLPDISELTKVLAQRAYKDKGREELKKALKKALDIDDAPPVPEGEGTLNQLNQPDEIPEPSAEEVLIDTILNAIPLFE